MGLKRIGSLRELLQILREDYATHWRRLSEPGLHVLVVHRYGVWVDGIGSRIARAPLRAIYYLLATFFELAYGFRLEHTVRVGRRVLFGHAASGITIGPRAVIGDDCILRQNVTLGSISHQRIGDPVLGDRIEVGAGAVIIGAISIGDDSMIGANTVVRRDVPPGTIVLPPEPTYVLRSRPKEGEATAPAEPDLTSIKDAAPPQP